MTSLMIKETQPTFFLAEREKKKWRQGEQCPLRSSVGRSPVSQHLRISEELLVIAGWERVLAPPEASFNTTWLGGTGGWCCYPLTPREEELIIVWQRWGLWLPTCPPLTPSQEVGGFGYIFSLARDSSLSYPLAFASVKWDENVLVWCSLLEERNYCGSFLSCQLPSSWFFSLREQDFVRIFFFLSFLIRVFELLAF